MKKFALIAMIVSVPLITLSAQELRTQTQVKKSESRLAQRLDAPNTITGQTVIFSGVVVQARKPHHFWQLFNPKAPMSYGDAEANTSRNPITGESQGILFLSVKF